MNPMTDRIVELLRASPAGVDSMHIAEEFLKLKAPDERLAHTMVAAVLAKDQRAVYGDDRMWHAAKVAAKDGDVRLHDMAWSAVALLAKGRQVMHVSVWSVLPEPQHQLSAWLSDPAALPAEEQELLRSPLDMPFAPGSQDDVLQQVAQGLAERVPVFLTSGDEGLLAWHCCATGIQLGDNAMRAIQLARASDVATPRPFSLDSLAQTLLGGAPSVRPAAGRGRLFAECVGELIARLERNGIESREAVESGLVQELVSFDFSGKQFDADTLNALRCGPGVYGFTDSSGNYVYIGKAANVRRRVSGYFGRTEESPTKLEQLRRESIGLTVFPCGSELESLVYEQRLIRKYSPRLNTQVEIAERRGQYRPIDDCVVLLPHAEKDKGMSVWFRRNQKINLRTFNDDFSDTETMDRELEQFFFSEKLATAPTDFSEQEIAQRWLSRRLDALPVVPAFRMATGKEVLAAMKLMWEEQERGHRA